MILAFTVVGLASGGILVAALAACIKVIPKASGSSSFIIVSLSVESVAVMELVAAAM